RGTQKAQDDSSPVKGQIILCLLCSSLCFFVALLLCSEAVVDSFYPAVRFDEAGAPGRPLRGQAFSLDLIHRFAGRDLLAHAFGGLLEHAVIALQIVNRRDWAVAGNQFRSRRDLADELADVPDQSFDCAPTLQIY